MQPNTITLAVDKLNTGATTDKDYSRLDVFQNRANYVATTHTLDNRDTVSLYRTFPKQSGNYKGVAKSSIKLTKDISVLGVDQTSSIISPIIIEVSFSVPVGSPVADVLELRQTVLSILDRDDIMNALNNQLMI